MNLVKTVTVFCGTGNQCAEIYKLAAKELGQGLAHARKTLVYGGATSGLMGIVADSMLAENGSVTGIMPRSLLEIEVLHPGLTETLIVDSLHTRKDLLLEKADVVVVLPGGFGTMEEVLETLTQKYLKIYDKKMFLVNVSGFFNPLLTMIDHMIEENFSQPWHRNLFEVVPDVKTLLLKI